LTLNADSPSDDEGTIQLVQELVNAFLRDNLQQSRKKLKIRISRKRGTTLHIFKNKTERNTHAHTQQIIYFGREGGREEKYKEREREREREKEGGEFVTFNSVQSCGSRAPKNFTLICFSIKLVSTAQETVAMAPSTSAWPLPYSCQFGQAFV